MIVLSRCPEDLPKTDLGSICEVMGGFAAPKGDEPFRDGTVPFVRMQDLGRYHRTTNLINTKDRLNADFVRKHRLRIVKKGSILMPRSGSVSLNHRAILGIDACIVSHICALVPNTQKVDSRYLYFALCNFDMRRIMRKTTGLDAITFEEVKRIKVPCPSMETQRKVANILQQVEFTLEKRRKANQLSSKMLLSVFLKMFGDPATNSKGWETTAIGDHAEIRYGTGSPPHYEDNGIPFVRATNIKMGRIVTREMKFISVESAKKIEKCKLHEGNILIVRSGVNTGDCAYVTREYNGSYAAYDLILDFDEELESRFIWGMLNLPYCRAIMKPMTLRAAQPHINAEQVSSIEVPKPPLELQRKFAKFIEKLHVLQEEQNQSAQEINELFQSLMYKAFRVDLAMRDAGTLKS